MIAKALINCAAAEATGGECSSAALGTLVTELVAASGMTASSPAEYRVKLELIAAAAGWLFSGGDPQKVYAAADAALRDFDNNLLPALIAVFVIGLTAADYALTAYDAYELTEAGLACDAGDQAACNQAFGMVESFAVETGITMTIGAFVPGDKVGMKIMAALRKNGSDEIVDATERAAREIGANTGAIGGTTCVYSCVVDGTTRYVGITDDVARRGREHFNTKGIRIEQFNGLDNLSRSDARAVEQTLIHYYGLGKDGGMLLNKINSISPTRNPTAYEESLIRGKELLDGVDYQWMY